MTRSRLAIRGLGPADLGRTAVAFMLAVVVEVGLRTLRLPRLASLLGVPLVTTSQTGELPAGRVILPHSAFRRLAAARRALRHWPFGDSCLRIALVGGCMVRGLDPSLRIGVAKHEGEIKAHAWLEIEGLSLDPDSTDFAPVESMQA